MIELFVDPDDAVKALAHQHPDDVRNLLKDIEDAAQASNIRDGLSWSVETAFDRDGNEYTDVEFLIQGRYTRNGELFVHGSLFLVNVTATLGLLRAELNEQ